MGRFSVQDRRDLGDNVKQLAHDIRTPLSTISAVVQILPFIIKGTDPISISEVIDPLQSATEKLVLAISNILNNPIADISPFDLSISLCNIKTIINSVIARTEKISSGHTIILNDDLTLDMFRCDASLFTAMLFNILDNAVKFSPSNTHINIHICNTCTHLHINIEDNGIGVTGDFIDRFNNQELCSSNGIGLYVAQQIASLHHGRIICANAQQGTIFHITIPC